LDQLGKTAQSFIRGNFGTFNWGSVAIDPERQIMFGMPTYLAFTSRLVPASQIPPREQDQKGSEQGSTAMTARPMVCSWGRSWVQWAFRAKRSAGPVARRVRKFGPGK